MGRGPHVVDFAGGHERIVQSERGAGAPPWSHLDDRGKLALRARLEAELERRATLWRCDRVYCDGEPHGPVHSAEDGYPVRHARWNQLPPPDTARWVDDRRGTRRQVSQPWFEWLIMAGRGWGKTRTGAEFVKWRNDHIGAGHRVALIGRTAADVRDTMIEGESGLLRCYRRSERPNYLPSKRRVEFDNGGVAFCYSSEEPDSLRGPQHHTGWVDELATFYALDTVISNYRLGMRLGNHPRCVITTTPQPHPELRKIITDPKTVMTTGTTYDNLANLATVFLDNVLRKYEGTSLADQELLGRYLDEAEGALWSRKLIERQRATPDLVAPYVHEMETAVAIDPAGKLKSARKGTATAETGIIVAGRLDDEGFVLDDLSGHHTPAAWARIALGAAIKWNAGYIVAEQNNGWDMVESTLRMVMADMRRAGEPLPRGIKIRPVTASKGKRTRAEPIATLSERGLWWFAGMFVELEDQCATWDPGQDSPDRLDAMVWVASHLFLRRRGRADVA
jgi:phage terminase large subunit-like protein